jgi:hypothetical protein
MAVEPSGQRSDLASAEGLMVNATLGLVLWAGILALIWMLYLL